MLTDLISNPIETIKTLLISLPAIFLALSAHEAAHGWVADRCGDPTARLMGRVTLNPLKHLDPIGFLCMMFAGFGWAKPVPVNPLNYRNYRKDDLRVSLAGITANLILFLLAFIIAVSMITAAYSSVPGFDSMEAYLQHLEDNHLTDENGVARENIAAIWKNEDEAFLSLIEEGEKAYVINSNKLFAETKSVYYSLVAGDVFKDSSLSSGAYLVSVAWGNAAGIAFQVLLYFIYLNLGLAAFNLIPLPPLDGYHVLNDLVLKRPLFADIKAQRTASGILIALILMGNISPRLDVVSIVISFVRDKILSGASIVWNSVLSLLNII